MPRTATTKVPATSLVPEDEGRRVRVTFKEREGDVTGVIGAIHTGYESVPVYHANGALERIHLTLIDELEVVGRVDRIEVTLSLDEARRLRNLLDHSRASSLNRVESWLTELADSPDAERHAKSNAETAARYKELRARIEHELGKIGAASYQEDDEPEGWVLSTDEAPSS